MAVHPYYPRSLELDGYVEPSHGLGVLLATMGAAIAAVAGVTHAAFGWRGVTRADRMAAQWFAVNGALHMVFELYFLVHFDDMAGRRDIVGSLWKEYAKGDSRYLARSAQVRMLETVTVGVVGPLCWAVVGAIWTRRAAVRDLAQLTASVLHVYSLALYGGTEVLGAESNSRPEALYYWGYFVGANAPWLVVPLWLAAGSGRRIMASQAAAGGSKQESKHE
ncbi:hypothetical protein GGF46_002474 [Coemansia sp. RSA 552]|nr:hypothetical protein GGF46_002474 [Coemansia sp. RSA 552]